MVKRRFSLQAYAAPQIVRAVSTPILSQARLNLAADLARMSRYYLNKQQFLIHGSYGEPKSQAVAAAHVGLDCSGAEAWGYVAVRQSEGPSDTDLSFFGSALEIKPLIES